MSAWLRFAIRTAIFVALLLLGAAIFDIRPTFAEILLICVSLGVAEGIDEALQ